MGMVDAHHLQPLPFHLFENLQLLLGRHQVTNRALFLISQWECFLNRSINSRKYSAAFQRRLFAGVINDGLIDRFRNFYHH